MKTKNVIILVGVLGVGGVGAYMYMKNKQAQDALLSGSLPATNQGGATTPSGTTTSGTTPSGTTASGTTTSGGSTPPLSTTSDGVNPSDANVNLANATILVGQRQILVEKTKEKAPPKPIGSMSMGTTMQQLSWVSRVAVAKKQLVELDAQLAKLGYKLDAKNQLVKI
jgi:hypothetical protein